jgi:hypothetical protein
VRRRLDPHLLVAGAAVITVACSLDSPDHGAEPAIAGGGSTAWVDFQPSWCTNSALGWEARVPCGCNACDRATELCFVDFPASSNTCDAWDSERSDDDGPKFDRVYRCTPRAGATFPDVKHPFEDHCQGTPSCSCMRMPGTGARIGDGDGDAGSEQESAPSPGGPGGPFMAGDDLLECRDLPNGGVVIGRLRHCTMGKGEGCGYGCATSLTCFDGLSGPACMTVGHVGDRCDDTGATCSEIDGLHCDLSLGVCSGAGAEGAWCDTEKEFFDSKRTSDCAKGLHCDDGGHCALPGADGAPCDDDRDTVQCASPFRCFEYVCRPRGAAGAECDPSRTLEIQCESSLHCDDAAHECVGGG